jgi:hypothetical protein
MDPRSQRLATLEPLGQVQWTRSRRKDTAMVVGRQQLESTRHEVAAEGHKASEECIRGESCLPESSTPWYTHLEQAY